MKAITENRLRQMAASCENARKPICRCRCGGALHGQHHSLGWIAETLFREQLQTQQANCQQLDWIGFEEFAGYF